MTGTASASGWERATWAAEPGRASLGELRASLSAWLRVLWNLNVPIGEAGDMPPFLAETGIHLPAPPPAFGSDAAGRWHRAAAAHAAAHIVFSRRIFAREGTAPITQALIGLLEDARVESLASRELPGLRRLWLAMHTVQPGDGDDFECLLQRLARALADPDYEDPHPWVRKGRAGFYLDRAGQVLAQARPEALRTLASALGHDLGQMRMAFNPRSYRPAPLYRDDNRWLWHEGVGDASRVRLQETQGSQPPVAARQTPRTPSSGSDGGGAGSNPPVLSPALAQWRYPEWDRLIGQLRPSWCTVHERRPITGLAVPREAPDSRLQRSLARLRLAAAQATRREREGDELDLDELLRTRPAHARGRHDDERLYRRAAHVRERVAALLLIDCSASCSGLRPGPSGISRMSDQLDVARRLSHALSEAGWAFAVQGFNSDGRQAVNCWCVKDFDDPWDAAGTGRLYGLQAGLSTRLGAALRHATSSLARQPGDRRLLVLLGDADPYDIDIHDGGYLAEDARHALRAARQAGLCCIALVPDGDDARAALHVFARAEVARLDAGAGWVDGLLRRRCRN